MKSVYILLVFALTINISFGQPPKTKLMVGIVVDQMRPDYLRRFYGQFGENGFKRLLREGFICRNTHIDYAPTVTGPGHASIYSGTTPKYHGIAENDWYDRNIRKMVYCAEDSFVQSVGNTIASKSSYSARSLLVTNLSDELKISTNKKGKVIAMSLKDRGATMPAGHIADGAFWFDQKTGNFISSTYYMTHLPGWATQFNNEKHAQKYLETSWDLLLPLNSYPMSIADDNPYESVLPGKSKPTFPYRLKDISEARGIPYYSIYASAFGNSLLADFAVDAIENAGLGTDEYPDLLAISFSSTDVVGHLFGPQSREVNDTYLRLDLDLARLFAALDKMIGKENYTLFLTADHGAGEVPQYLADMNIPAGYIDTAVLVNDASQQLANKFGSGKWVECFISNQFYLNRSLAKAKGMDISVVQDFLAEILRNTEGVAEVFTATQLLNNEYSADLANRVQKGYYAGRSGDVIYVLHPNWNEKSAYSATHGSPYAFDTHIPLIWYGAGIAKGESYTHYNVTDIAPTVSSILHIKLPGSCIGDPIKEAIN